MIKLCYRTDRDMFRVWQENWGGDQFEVFDRDDFYQLMDFCKRLSIPLIEAED